MDTSRPKPTGSSTPPTPRMDLTGFDWTLGLKVRTTNIHDLSQTGTITAYEPQTGSLLLRSPSSTASTSSATYILVKTRYLKEVVVLESSSPTKYTNAEPKIGTVNLASVAAREQKSLKAEEGKVARKGVGVSKEAQVVFDGLSRTLPCRWSGSDIIVLDQFKISAPYTIEKIATPKGTAEDAVNRLKKVLGRLREQMKLDVPVEGEERLGG